jgi:enoyl-CoA hydratase/carnithine racemase
MTSEVVRITERDAAYWTATIDSPPLNLFGAEMHAGLRLLLDRMEASSHVKVVVLESAVPDYWIAHFDLEHGLEVPDIPGAASMLEWPETVRRLASSPVITIASIRGRARGQGSETALACDLRFASVENAILGQPEVGIGLLAGSGALAWLPALVGRSRALEIAIGCADFDASTAERYGWINRALPDSRLDEFVDELARRIASFPREAIAATKKEINERSTVAAPDALRAVQRTFAELMRQPETRARTAAALRQGLQKPGDFELHLGDRLAELAHVTMR